MMQRQDDRLMPGAGEAAFDVCIDGRLLDAGRTGVSNYASRLAATLAAHGRAPIRLDAIMPGPGRGHDFIRYARAALPGRRPVYARPAENPDFAGSIVGRDIFREAYLHFKFHRRMMALRCDRAPGLMHWTYPLPLYIEGWRNIYTVHDLIPLRGDGISPVRPRRHERLLRRIAERADRLVTVSEAVRRDVIAMLGCAPELVVSSGQIVGLSQGGASMAGAPQGGHFLFCGSIEPRKNLVRLVEAYRASGTRRPLVLVGPDGWRAAEVRDQIGAPPGVTFLSFQSAGRLAQLVRTARALLFPSLAEGFGLPVAEAMALGTPVMASAIPALLEVAGDAALFVDPHDVAAMTRAIRRLDQDDPLCARLSALGVAKAVDYQSDRYFERLQRIYADVERNPGFAMARHQ